jgi:hypothetical protein
LNSWDWVTFVFRRRWQRRSTAAPWGRVPTSRTSEERQCVAKLLRTAESLSSEFYPLDSCYAIIIRLDTRPPMDVSRSLRTVRNSPEITRHNNNAYVTMSTCSSEFLLILNESCSIRLNLAVRTRRPTSTRTKWTTWPRMASTKWWPRNSTRNDRT